MSGWGMNNSASSGGFPTPGEAAGSTPNTGATKPRSQLQSLAERLSGGGKAKMSKIESVKVDGLVLLKMIKHCTESLPELCSGSLLGMDAENKLEVTNCFPFPEVQDDSEEDSEGAKYQMEMLKLLRDINVDCNPVGWYRSAYLGSFCTSNLVNQLFQYQEQLEKESGQKSVVLVYDPFQTKKGNLALKAFRLSDAFMRMYRDTKRSSDSPHTVKLSPAVVAAIDGLRGDGSAVVASTDNELTANDIFEEVPVEISNAHLFTVLIEDLKDMNGSKLDVDFDRLNLSTNPFLEKNFEFLVEEVDNLAGEQQKKQRERRNIQKIEQDQIKWIQQRRLENKAREERGEPALPHEDGDPNLSLFQPIKYESQLESLLIRKQISIYTDQVNKFTGSSFAKLYLSSAIQGNQPK